MAPVTIYDPNDSYWIWNERGPSFNEIVFGVRFIDGYVPNPVSGKEAEKFAAYGYKTTLCNGEQFSHWVND